MLALGWEQIEVRVGWWDRKESGRWMILVFEGERHLEGFAGMNFAVEEWSRVLLGVWLMRLFRCGIYGNLVECIHIGIRTGLAWLIIDGFC